MAESNRFRRIGKYEWDTLLRDLQDLDRELQTARATNMTLTAALEALTARVDALETP